jgi:hypothetical protein
LDQTKKGRDVHSRGGKNRKTKMVEREENDMVLKIGKNKKKRKKKETMGNLRHSISPASTCLRPQNYAPFFLIF